MKAEIIEDLKAAKKALAADIPSHPMRDKCFAAMHKTRAHIDAALAKLERLVEREGVET